MKRASMYGILMIALVSLVDIAHAQSKSSTAGRVEAKRGEIQSMRLLAQPRSQNRGVSLMTRSRNANANGSVLSFTPMTIGPSLQVLGGGTLGRLTKWTGLTSSNSFIGDSSIFEDKFGKVGIGTDSPSSTLTVAGMIEITLGGLKFPDGTVQTTSAAGALFSVAHDLTLQGNGTSGSPLGVAVPLALTGSSSPTELVRVLNTATSGAGVFGGGGPGGTGVKAAGGKSTGARGGGGVEATGGDSTVDGGGVGVSATGGDGNDFGGRGVLATGGNGIVPGPGVEAAGGVSTSGNGGNGVNALGGNGSGAGNSGGIGIVAQGGANGATFGLAGKFNGNVQVTGNLSKGGGAFKIDHPLDPEKK